MVHLDFVFLFSGTLSGCAICNFLSIPVNMQRFQIVGHRTLLDCLRLLKVQLNASSRHYMLEEVKGFGAEVTLAHVQCQLILLEFVKYCLDVLIKVVEDLVNKLSSNQGKQNRSFL